MPRGGNPMRECTSAPALHIPAMARTLSASPGGGMRNRIPWSHLIIPSRLNPHEVSVVLCPITRDRETRSSADARLGPCPGPAVQHGNGQSQRLERVIHGHLRHGTNPRPGRGRRRHRRCRCGRGGVSIGASIRGGQCGGADASHPRPPKSLLVSTATTRTYRNGMPAPWTDGHRFTRPAVAHSQWRGGRG